MTDQPRVRRKNGTPAVGVLLTIDVDLDTRELGSLRLRKERLLCSVHLHRESRDHFKGMLHLLTSAMGVRSRQVPLPPSVKRAVTQMINLMMQDLGFTLGEVDGLRPDCRRRSRSWEWISEMPVTFLSPAHQDTGIARPRPRFIDRLLPRHENGGVYRREQRWA